MAVELVGVDDVKPGTHIPALMHIQAFALAVVTGAGTPVPAPCAEDSLQTHPREARLFVSPITIPGKRGRMPPSWRRDKGRGKALALTQKAALDWRWWRWRRIRAGDNHYWLRCHCQSRRHHWLPAARKQLGRLPPNSGHACSRQSTSVSASVSRTKPADSGKKVWVRMTRVVIRSRVQCTGSSWAGQRVHLQGSLAILQR